MEPERPDGIIVATYNVLADAYVRPEYYPRCDRAVFPAARRYPRVVERVVGLGADVICLQEVDETLFLLLDARLARDGYRCRWAGKGGGKPDGCAAFVREPCVIADEHVLAYADGGGANGRSGHVASLMTVANGERRLIVANTHLKWDAPDVPRERRIGLAQARELLASLANEPLPAVVCGDFNAEPGSDLLDAFHRAGFADAHDALTATCAPGGRAVKIDHLLYGAALSARPLPTPAVTDDAALPSASEPSDHVPLAAVIRHAA